MAERPTLVRLRSYQVGFGDCFLLSFVYQGHDDRHVLIDFGTTGIPASHAGDGPREHMLRVARDIAAVTGNRLSAVVATHRHEDHVSGFATRPQGDGPGDIIRGLAPDLVVQPWTEDPRAEPDATAPTALVGDDLALVRALEHMHAVSRVAHREATRTGAAARFTRRIRDELAFLGEDNIKNRSAVDNLIAMGEAGDAEYLYYGSRSKLEELLPGVTVKVLGPPTLAQSSKIRKQRASDEEEFWHLQALAGRAVGGDDESPEVRPAFGAEHAAADRPANARWLIGRMQRVRGRQLLSIVRALDKAMNNTSLILLFEVGDRRLLFPGDAQIENWLHALADADEAEDNRRALAGVDVYKVGHHGSLNATPKSLWSLFFEEGEQRGPNAPRPLVSVCSTMAGKHGHVESETEVPRRTLVEALATTDYHTTQELADSSVLYWERTWEIT